MSITVIGNSAMVEQPTERSWTKEGQLIVTRVFRGPPITSLVTDKEDEMRTAGADRVTSTIGKNATVRADFSDPLAIESAPGGGVPYDPDQYAEDNAIWELIGADLEIALALHPAFNISPGSSPGVIEVIERDIQNHVAASQDYNALYSGTTYNGYRDLRLMGAESFISFSYIVRKTVQSPRSTAFKLSAAVAPGSVIAWAGINIPANAKFAQPKIRLGDAAEVSVNQWLVKAPQCRWTGKLYELTQEWWGAISWNKYLYNGGTGNP